MNNLEITANTDLNIIDYIKIVDAIAIEFFDEDGEYCPHIGNLNAMRLFYNECVTESKFDIPHTIIGISEMEPLVVDYSFVCAFNEAVKDNGVERLDFANAYKHALDIVNTKKSSIGGAVSILKSAIKKVVDIITPVLSEENIAKISQIAKDISDGKITEESIVEAYAKMTQ